MASIYIIVPESGPKLAVTANTPAFVDAQVMDMDFELKEPFEMDTYIEKVKANPRTELYNITVAHNRPGLWIYKYQDGYWREVPLLSRNDSDH